MWGAEENNGWKFEYSEARSAIVFRVFGILRWLSEIMGASFGPPRGWFWIKWWEFGVLRD